MRRCTAPLRPAHARAFAPSSAPKQSSRCMRSATSPWLVVSGSSDGNISALADGSDNLIANKDPLELLRFCIPPENRTGTLKHGEPDSRQLQNQCVRLAMRACKVAIPFAACSLVTIRLRDFDPIGL